MNCREQKPTQLTLKSSPSRLFGLSLPQENKDERQPIGNGPKEKPWLGARRKVYITIDQIKNDDEEGREH